MTDVVAGGMGVVYFLQCTLPGGDHLKFALKSCDPDKLFATGGLGMLKDESLLWISLPLHPNVVKASSFEIDGGLPYLTMEYIEGGNLRAQLARGPLPLGRALSMASAFCEGMTFLACAADVVHRDIKPENILFSAAGLTKITDFGLARARLTASTGQILETGIDSSNVLAGTLAYMAPEQFDALNDADARSDVYSFGVVLYEILAGRRPFEAHSVDDFRRAHREDSPPVLGDEIPIELRAIVARCLEKQPAARFATFAELGNEINRYCRDNGFESSIAEHHSLEAVEGALDSWEWNSRGYSLSQLGRFEDALRCYERGIDRVSQEPDEGNYLITPGVDKKKNAKLSQLATLHDNRGALLLRMGRIEEGRAAFAEALRILPDDGLALLRLGQMALAEGKVDEGLVMLRRSTECEPGNSDLLLKYVRACARYGATEAFESGFALFLEAKKGEPIFLTMTGCLFDDEGQPGAALRCYDASLDHDPDFAHAWFNKAVTLHRLGRVAEAVAGYENAVRTMRTHPLARFYLGIAKLQLGRRDEGLWHLKECVKGGSGADPRSAEMARAIIEGHMIGVPSDVMIRMFAAYPQAFKHIA